MADRSGIRSAAYRAHTTYVSSFPECPWCGEPITAGFEAHEALVKRSAVPKGRQELIFVIENVVPLHVECHQQHGQTLEMKKRCLWALAFHVGAKCVGMWYTSLWQEHELSVPKGLLVPHDKVPPYEYNRYALFGAKLMKIVYDPDANWEYDHGKRTLDFRAAVGSKWAGRRGHSKIHHPREMNGVTARTMTDMIDEGYWLQYLSGLVGSTPEEIIRL